MKMLVVLILFKIEMNAFEYNTFVFLQIKHRKSYFIKKHLNQIHFPNR